MMAWDMNYPTEKSGTKSIHFFLTDTKEQDLRVLRHWRQFQKGMNQKKNQLKNQKVQSVNRQKKK